MLHFKFWNRRKHGNMKLERAVLYDSRVTFLQIPRPKGYHFHVGDYLSINIPAIAKYEWHPFTISSPPELKDSLFLHIRVLGHWTKQLYDILKALSNIRIKDKSPYKKLKLKEMKKTVGALAYVNKAFSNTSLNPEPVDLIANDLKNRRPTIREAFDNINIDGDVNSNGPTIRLSAERLSHLGPIYLDGPFGGTHVDALETEHPVLICTGIGVTPFAAVLQSVIYRHVQQCIRCPQCDDVVWQKPEISNPMNRIDFFWINREADNLEWFTELFHMLQSTHMGPGSFMDFVGIHLYITGVVEKDFFNSLSAIVSHRQLINKRIASGMRGTFPEYTLGRPNWRWEFNRIRDMNKGKVKVFYCGNRIISPDLKKYCQEYKFNFAEEHF